MPQHSLDLQSPEDVNAVISAIHEQYGRMLTANAQEIAIRDVLIGRLEAKIAELSDQIPKLQHALDELARSQERVKNEKPDAPLPAP